MRKFDLATLSENLLARSHSETFFISILTVFSIVSWLLSANKILVSSANRRKLRTSEDLYISLNMKQEEEGA